MLDGLVLFVRAHPGIFHKSGPGAEWGHACSIHSAISCARPVLLRVAKIMAMEAVGFALQQGRPFAASRPGDGFPSRFIHGHGIHAIDLHARDAVRRRHIGNISDQGNVFLGRPLGVPIVLTDIDHREFPHRPDVDIFVKWPAVGSAVAKEAHRHLATAPHLRCQTSPGGQAKAAGHDTIGPQHAHLKIGNMHGATFAFTIASRAPKQLGHHALNIGPFGNAVAMSAVRAGNVVGVAEVGTHRHGHPFFPNIGMQGAHDLALAGLIFGLFFEQTDTPHAGVHLKKFFCGWCCNGHQGSSGIT